MTESKPKFKRNYNITKSLQVLKEITKRELGIYKGAFEMQLIKLKVQQLRRSNEEFEIDPDISFCKFLKTGDTGSIIGVWQRNMDPASKHSSVYHLKFEYNPQCYSGEFESCPLISNLSCCGPFFKRMDVMDSCEKYIKGQTFMLYVGNTAISGGRIVLNVTDVNLEPPVFSLPERIWCSSKRIWSCAGNIYSERFAAGAEKSCFLFDTVHFIELQGFMNDVLSVEFSENGNLLYCGIDNSEVILCDLRENVYQVGGNHLYNKLGLSGVKEMKLLADEITMVASETDGKLYKIDLRMRKPFFQFPGRINKFGRRPLSIDEGLDLLCATGDDNSSKIWSLGSGELLKSIHALHPNITSHACLISEERRWFVAMVQANILTPILHY